ncbi:MULTISPECIES: thioredoxin family protein [Actinomadura]|uniref:Thioredoxin family protein n=1 Tax=Actinomadura yumaensis TaxID=111807 RepID=A0ABW2CYA2_9ACTN|nr:thioredoxin family protein [Actinomadura sp. J1-007]
MKSCAILAAALFAVAACGDSGSSESNGGAGTSTAPSAAPSTPANGSAPAGPAARPPKPEPLPKGYDPDRDPKADIAAALAKAKADKRPVLLDFGADWCPDCVVLERYFRTATVRPVIGGFHVVAIDVGRFDRNLAVARKYRIDLQKSGIPALVVLTPSGRVRATTNDGSFATAATMTPRQVARHLKRWR